MAYDLLFIRSQNSWEKFNAFVGFVLHMNDCKSQMQSKQYAVSEYEAHHQLVQYLL